MWGRGWCGVGGGVGWGWCGVEGRVGGGVSLFLATMQFSWLNILVLQLATHCAFYMPVKPIFDVLPVIAKIRCHITHDLNQEIHHAFLLFSPKHHVQKWRQYFSEHNQRLGAILAACAASRRLHGHLRFVLVIRRIDLGFVGDLVDGGGVWN